MKNLKILSYQRNGVMGNGFYTATCTEFGNWFVVTFETEEGTDGTETILLESCRATCLEILTEKWRGDDFARDIQKIINKKLKTGQTIYDLIETKPAISPFESGRRSGLSEAVRFAYEWFDPANGHSPDMFALKLKEKVSA